MSETDTIVLLKQENERLKRENEILMETVCQIRTTVNRLIDRYVIRGGAEKDLPREDGENSFGRCEKLEKSGSSY